MPLEKKVDIRFAMKGVEVMVLNNCKVCAVYEPDHVTQKRIPVQCKGEQVTLLMSREHELSDSSQILIDFFDSQIGCVKAYCELAVRQNYDTSIQAPWIADCEIQEVLEIVEGRRSVRTKMEKEVTFTSPTGESFSGVIQNISEGGIYFITRTRQQCDDTAVFSYSFVEKEYQMSVLILREEVFRDGRYGYGCQFLAMPKGAGRDIKIYQHMLQNGRII